MKYLLIFMCFLIAFSLPLADLGYYIYPNFSDSLRTFEQLMDKTDTFGYKMLTKTVSFFSPQKDTLRADLYTFDSNNVYDLILAESDLFSHVQYAIVLPYSLIRDRYELLMFAKVNASYYHIPGDFLGNWFNAKKCHMILCFDEYGEFLHYFTYYKGQSGLTEQKFIDGCYFMFGPNYLHFPFVNYDISFTAYGNTVSFEVNTSDFPTVHCYKQGSFIDLVNKYQS